MAEDHYPEHAVRASDVAAGSASNAAYLPQGQIIERAASPVWLWPGSRLAHISMMNQ
jgi:hypothetical protein